MKKLLFPLLCLIMTFTILSCEQSEGLKFGTLQKVSHKTFPCSYYEIEVAYEGGRVVTSGGENPSSAHSNTQQIAIDKVAFDTLQQYLGEKVIFDYKDDGISFCAPTKVLKSIKIKK